MDPRVATQQTALSRNPSLSPLEDSSSPRSSYQSQSSAATKSLIASHNDGSSYIGVDHTSVLTTSGAGRESVRISSKKTFTHGLFLADIAHMPGSICGTWPACGLSFQRKVVWKWKLKFVVWMFGPSWPNSGEIDIIEGRFQDTNEHTLASHFPHPNGSWCCD